MSNRRCFKETESFRDRLQDFANDVRAQAAELPASSERDELLRKARQVETASHLDEWINSPGLQSPK